MTDEARKRAFFDAKRISLGGGTIDLRVSPDDLDKLKRTVIERICSAGHRNFQLEEIGKNHYRLTVDAPTMGRPPGETRRTLAELPLGKSHTFDAPTPRVERLIRTTASHVALDRGVRMSAKVDRTAKTITVSCSDPEATP